MALAGVKIFGAKLRRRSFASKSINMAHGEKSQDKHGDKGKTKDPSSNPKHSSGGGDKTNSSYSSSQPTHIKKPWCFVCKNRGHRPGDKSCLGKPPEPTTTNTSRSSAPSSSGTSGGTAGNSQAKGVVGFTYGSIVETGVVSPKTVSISGVEAQAYRDTGASITLVTENLVPPEQHIIGQQYKIIDVHNSTKFLPLAIVQLSWGGVTGPKQVVVSPSLPVDCLLGNDLEASGWADVEFYTHAAMLGIPEELFPLISTEMKKQRREDGLRTQDPSPTTGTLVRKSTLVALLMLVFLAEFPYHDFCALWGI
ncbi:hypothetical protein NDU88_007910 [Pleurodeles waltl]|uniref:Peptidase A2 domain-containing protein n=1 Tax=Pleurodeles waltl TaxID=8319 RepID=A0AAV7U2Y3_PLEWA|nr:hypothetical protein NDU88_007910 [Pleurodeles waltl]